MPKKSKKSRAKKTTNDQTNNQKNNQTNDQIEDQKQTNQKAIKPISMAETNALFKKMQEMLRKEYEVNPTLTRYGPNEAVKEAVKYNLFEEQKGILRLISLAKEKDYPEDKYNIARSLIYGYIIECIRKDPDNGDYYNEENLKKLKEGGKMLYDNEGMQGMRDDLLWSFIPKRYQREIDMVWNGIGQWVS
jgi:hypothetical protein